MSQVGLRSAAAVMVPIVLLPAGLSVERRCVDGECSCCQVEANLNFQ